MRTVDGLVVHPETGESLVIDSGLVLFMLVDIKNQEAIEKTKEFTTVL